MSNQKREVLGMSISTAVTKLRKVVLFNVLRSHNENVCYRCRKPIELVNEFSIDHKIDWLNAPNARDLFWDVENIAFSHLRCNVGASSGGQVTARRKRKSPEHHKQWERAYRQTEKYKSYRRQYERSRYATDPEYRQYYLDKDKNRRP